VYLQNGTVVYSAAQRDCPELHGSAGNGNRALFACSDGILVITFNRKVLLFLVVSSVSKMQRRC
jgi:hypothetical protein